MYGGCHGNVLNIIYRWHVQSLLFAVVITRLELFLHYYFFICPGKILVMATPTKDYLYQVEFNIHAVDAPGARLIKTGDIYLNICLLGKHKRTRLMPAYLPMHIDQKLFFDKVNICELSLLSKGDHGL